VTVTAEPGTGDLPTGPDLARELGITYRQLDFAIRKEWLRPVRQWRGQRRGSGSPRWLPEDEMEIGRRMGRLTAAGIPPSLAASFARHSWPRGEIAPGIWIEVTP
jgi:hypothetical protein